MCVLRENKLIFAVYMHTHSKHLRHAYRGDLSPLVKSEPLPSPTYRLVSCTTSSPVTFMRSAPMHMYIHACCTYMHVVRTCTCIGSNTCTHVYMKWWKVLFLDSFATYLAKVSTGCSSTSSLLLIALRRTRASTLARYISYQVNLSRKRTFYHFMSIPIH